MDKSLPSSDAKSVEEELLRLLARQGRRVPIPVFLAAALIAGIVMARVPGAAWMLWLTLVAAILVARWLILGRLPGFHGMSVQRRLHIATALSAINGAAHGLSLVFFDDLTVAERAIQSFLLIGLCAGSVATTGGYRPVFLAYLLPTIGPLAILWIVVPASDEIGWVNEATGAIIALFGLVLIALARDAHRLFRESFEIRLQQIELNRQLKAALEMAELASTAKTRFLASASHDLRQPVHTLSLFAAALEVRPLDDRTRDISNHINTALQVLAAQLDSLLDVSKLDAGVVEVNPSRVALSPMLRQIAEEAAPQAHEKGLFVVVDCPAELQARTDAMLFSRVVRNLVGNAVKYTDSGGIRLEGFRQGGKAILIISDTGRGIPESEQGRVFEEFYQLDNPERDRTKGLGLGLAIVRRLVDLLGIRLEMVSAPGKGTLFYLMLDEAEDHVMPSSQPAREVPSTDTLDVLVVDDEASIREGMRILLEEMGSRVVLADSTESAKAAVLARRPDIVLADLRLRGEDNGIRTVEAVRALYPGVPAILISGETGPGRLLEAEHAGLRMLHKPVAGDVLRREIAIAVNELAQQGHA